MRPAHNPTPVVYKSNSEDPSWKERQKRLLDFHNDIREKAERIPYSHVLDGISIKMSEQLTHPTTLRVDRWRDVMAKLGYPNMCLQAKMDYHKNWRRGEEAETPFYLFLTRVFAEDGGTLWKVIEALKEEKYTDVIEKIRTDVSEFVASYTPVAVNQQDLKDIPLDTLDSGVGQSLRSNENPQSLRRGGNYNLRGHAQSPTRNHDLLINPQRRHLVVDYVESLDSKRGNSQENLFWPKQDPFPKSNFRIDDYEEDDDNLKFSFPFGKKSSTGIKVFIPHTESDEDEEIAEEVAGRLEDEHQFQTYLLKNTLFLNNVDVDIFVMNIMENMDFLVPILSRAYLQQIVPVGDTSDMSDHRLMLRHLHAVSQTRVINKNSLNYIIRPVIVHDVNYGMVRRWHEFQSAVKYPKDLGRLAKNLKATKEILVKKHGRR